jgi:aldose 1-epimerase
MEGTDVDQYILYNNKGIEVSVIIYGGIITSWTAAKKNGNYMDVELGYNTLAEYEAKTPYFGALICRYYNRLRKYKSILKLN